MPGYYGAHVFKDKCCEECGTVFSPNSGAAKYCSDVCRRKSSALLSKKYRQKDNGIYHVYWNMVRRCTNEDADHYEFYGERGITVCDSWMESFDSFKEDMGPRPIGTTLDRIDPTKGYSPSNCRWATWDVQHNNKTNSRLIEYNGETLSISQWARRLQCTPRNIVYRIEVRGMSEQEAVSTPVKQYRRKEVCSYEQAS
jgi:hypothetical protein